MHDLYSFLNRKPSHLKLREYVKTNNTTCFNIAKVYVNRILSIWVLQAEKFLLNIWVLQAEKFLLNIYSYLTVELRPFRFVGPVWLLGFANLKPPSE